MMGLNPKILCAVAVAVCAYATATPYSARHHFLRSAVETVPAHEALAPPIRASIESIPLKNLRDDGDGRVPLRDAVEKRPIETLDVESLYKYFIEESQDPETSISEEGDLRNYYGAASYLNGGNKNNERLQQGNANLQAMQQTASSPSERKLVVCYLESWAAYRSPPLAFTASLVPRTCTHLHYAFATIHPHTYTLIPTNGDYDVVKGGYRIATGLKHRYPGLKVLISVGGEGTGRLFSQMVKEKHMRSNFINSAADFLREHDFDGMDLHWGHTGENSDNEKEQLTSLLFELREKFSAYGLLLSTVLPPFRYQIEDGYDIRAVSGTVDYATLHAWDMTYDREETPSRALHHSPLHKDPGATGSDQKYDNIEFMVKYIIRRGMAAEKLVLGVPLFGRSYTLSDSAMPGPGASVKDWGSEGPYTQTKGLLSYFEICMMEQEGKGSSYVDEFGNTYAVFDRDWVSYNSPSTVVEKMKFVVSAGLGGAAAWAVDLDDFRGLCGAQFPMINAMYTSLNGQLMPTDQSTLKLGPCESDRPYLASDEESCAHYQFCTGTSNYKLVCEEDRLYDPSTGFCGHQDATKCIPGQSLRIGTDEAMRFLHQAYETDFEWNSSPGEMSEIGQPDAERLIESHSGIRKSKDNDKRVVCYMTSWAFYRRGEGKFVPEHIDTRLCTHVVYAYASLTPDDLVAKEFDPWADITNNLYERVTSLGDVKVLLGLGGWTDSAGDKYSRLVSSPSSRSKFIQKLIPFLKMHNFKGLHLDWNYPVCWQSNCKKGARSDKTNYAQFVQELSSALHAAEMELGVAVSGYKEVIEAAYDLPALSRSADFLSAMTYDYHGGWERKTAHHTPLVPLPGESLGYYSVEYAVKALLKNGADPKKLNLGIAFYGQSFRLADLEAPGTPGAPASGPGEPGEFTKQPGMLAYYEICYRVKNIRWKTGRQDKAGPYAYLDNQWVGYDDPTSITEKVEWALKQGLGGVTAWAIDLDDFNNRCCDEPSPLLRAAGRALGRSVPGRGAGCERPPPPVTPAPPTTTTVAADGSDGSHQHDHGSHDHSTTTTWPSWTPPSTTTTQSWWQQSSTTTTTSTTTPKTTTQSWWQTQSTTTTPKPTTQSWWQQSTTTPSTTTPSTTTQSWWQQSTTSTKRPSTARPTTQSGIEGNLCTAGEYRPAPGDCASYLQCEGGHWRKQSCAPGLHWFASATRCDWPAFAKCKETTSSESSPATTTLAPTTSRPPSTTTRRTTTTTTTTQRPSTTTTRRTTTTTVAYRPPVSGGPTEGDPCVGDDYHETTSDCNAYLHCDSGSWRLQRCAPGLHWSSKDRYCDWPKYAKCTTTSETITAPKPTPPSHKPPKQTTSKPSSDSAKEGGSCGIGEIHTSADTCEHYLLCVSGSWRKQNCPNGLHWDNQHKRCDWPDFANCVSMSDKASTTTHRPFVFTRPSTKKPIISFDEPVTDSTFECSTGTYHAHPHCNKFYVCVNSALVTQACAPGLVWNAARSQCDFPTSTSCTDKRQTGPGSASMKIKLCNNGEFAVYEGDCTRYRHCIFGQFVEFSCSAGLHWNNEKHVCDWPQSARCIKPGSAAKPVQGAPSKPNETPAIVDLQENRNHFPDGTRPALHNSKYKLVCYYTNWSWYRPGPGKYSPEDIDPTLCTHIVYGFAVLGSDGLITAHDPWADFDNRLYERVVAYKRYGIKVLIAIGGWNDSAGDKYSKLVNNRAARARFVTDVVHFITKYNFDGLDLDWDYPKCWQVDCSKGPDSDKSAFAALVMELSAVFKPKGLLLSSAVSANKRVIDAGYDVPKLAKHLDWIAVMTYDYHGQWDKQTGHVAPLDYHPDDEVTYLNANYTMHYWMKKGAPSTKLIMGIPLYGQSFTLSTDNSSGHSAFGLHVPAVSGGEPGEYNKVKGFLPYYEICDRIKNRNWNVVHDKQNRMGPYAYKGNQWVSFDDVHIIKKKVHFIKSLHLGGGMVWAMDLDDFRNRCGDGSYPLLNAVKNGLLDKHTHLDKNSSKPVVMQKPPPTKVIEHDDFNHLQYPSTPPPSNAATEKYKVVCYYTNWAWYRPQPGKFTPSDIDPSMCTHIVYAFAVLDSEKLIIKSHDVDLDVDNKFYEKVTALNKHGIKVLLGLGGWKDSAGDKYSRLVNNAAARRTFVIHTVDFLEQYGFDGLDLDWEYPKCWQAECGKGPNADKQGFANLVKDLRKAFDQKGWLLSAAVSASKRVIDFGYDVPSLSKNLDWIAVMTYDYHGQWEKKTGHVAPMYARHEDDDPTFNVNFTMHYWINKGAARQKMVLGIPLYGHSFSLVEGAGHGFGTPAYAGGDPGDITRARGTMAFYEICEQIRVHGWRVHRDPGGRLGPYATLNDQWVSFDDDIMVRHKAEYIREMGLGGGMVWAMDLDDFTGRFCSCGKSPLLANLNHVLRKRPMPDPCSLEEVRAPESETEQEAPEKINHTSSSTEAHHHHHQDHHQHHQDTIPQIVSDTASSDSLNGRTCSGPKFAADPNDCTKYYLCINGHYTQLTCPSPLHWNQNHCDWPSESQCLTRAQLRISADTDSIYEEVQFEDKPIIGCYFTNWAYYRHENGSFGPDEIDASLCTHIVYAWAHLDPETYEIVPGNPELDIENDFYGRVTELRLREVKVILGVGGLEDTEDDKWSRLAADQDRRDHFVRSTVTFIKRWNFSGLQFAWQYPVCRQEPCSDETRLSDRENFSILVQELSKALRDQDLEFSVMVSASPGIASMAYDSAVLMNSVDWISVAANDYYAAYSDKTSYLMPLNNSDGNSFNSLLSYWKSVVPGRQVVVGVPGYARTYMLRSAATAAPGAPVVGPGLPGLLTDVPGFLAYHEVCSGVQSLKWSAFSSDEGSYAVWGRQWASYLSPRQVHRLARRVRAAGLRGAALWALDLDDWRGLCACAPQPLLRAMRDGFIQPDLPATCT